MLGHKSLICYPLAYWAFFIHKRSYHSEIKYKNKNLTRVALPKKNAEAAVESHKKLVLLAHEYEPKINEYRQRRKDIAEMIIDIEHLVGKGG